MVKITLLYFTIAPVLAAVSCGVIYTLPSTGNVTSDLPRPPRDATLKAIAIGHGIQNYSCESINATNVDSKGALAMLYDATALYPGTHHTGLSQATWNSLPTEVLFKQNIPLILINPSAAKPGSIFPEKEYSAVASNPFPDGNDLAIAGRPVLPFLGHHFFDINNNPIFDLPTAGLLINVSKRNATDAPASANKGVIGTGAIPWLLLSNSPSGDDVYVYRVITAGGAPQACSEAGEGLGSVPYTAFYWFWEGKM